MLSFRNTETTLLLRFRYSGMRQSVTGQSVTDVSRPVLCFDSLDPIIGARLYIREERKPKLLHYEHLNTLPVLWIVRIYTQLVCLETEVGS